VENHFSGKQNINIIQQNIQQINVTIIVGGSDKKVDDKKKESPSFLQRIKSLFGFGSVL